MVLGLGLYSIFRFNRRTLLLASFIKTTLFCTLGAICASNELLIGYTRWCALIGKFGICVIYSMIYLIGIGWFLYWIGYGDSDVGGIVMLATLWWWLIWDVTTCRWQNHYVGDFFRYVGDFLNVLRCTFNRSPTSRIGHQHLKLVTNTFGPTSVTNIDISNVFVWW